MTEAFVAWRDWAKDATIESIDGDELMPATNMLIRGGPERARIDNGSDPLLFTLDLGASRYIDVVALLGCNVQNAFSLEITLGSAAPDDGDSYTVDYITVGSDAMFWGGQIVLPLPETVSARYVTFSGSWTRGSDDFWDVRRCLVMQALRIRGVSIESSLSSASRGEVVVSDAQTAEVRDGVSYRTWAVALRNLSLFALYGDDAGPGTTIDLQMLQGTAGLNPEVLLIPRSDNAHMIYRTAIVGRVVGGVQIPGRAKGGMQHANFQLEEIIYRA